MANEVGRERHAEPPTRSRSTGTRRGRPGGVARARATYKVGSGLDATVDLEAYMGMRYDLGGCLRSLVALPGQWGPALAPFDARYTGVK